MKAREIPFHRPSIGEAEIAAVTAVIRSGWLTTGRITSEFEGRFADYVGSPHAVGVNSCSSGLQLALRALGVGPGDEVITSPITFCATVLAIIHAGATPVLADVGADGNLDPACVQSRITSRTRALVPVHLGGNPCQMGALWTLAAKHRLYVVEDAAHALGARYGAGSRVGGDTRSDAVVFSFYATKSLTTGEGGMVTTHRADLCERMRLLGYHGIGARDDWQYSVIEEGFKFNLSDIQSAMGLEQLKQQEAFLEDRIRCARIYDEELGGVAAIDLPSRTSSPGNCRHLYRLGVPSRDEFIRKMKERGIACSVHFIPIQLHPVFSKLADCPRAVSQYARSVSLPIYPSMSDDDVRYVAQCVREIVR